MPTLHPDLKMPSQPVSLVFIMSSCFDILSHCIVEELQAAYDEAKTKHKDESRKLYNVYC